MASTQRFRGLENASLETARSWPQAVVVKPDDRHGPKLPQGVDRDLVKILRKLDRDVIPHSIPHPMRRIQTALVVQHVGQVFNHAHLLAGFADGLKSGDLCARGKGAMHAGKAAMRRDADGDQDLQKGYRRHGGGGALAAVSVFNRRARLTAD
jgi:hypothetical protein